MKYCLCFHLFDRQVGRLTVIIKRCNCQVVKTDTFFWTGRFSCRTWTTGALRNKPFWIANLFFSFFFFNRPVLLIRTFYKLCIISQVQRSICISCFMLLLLLSNCYVDVWLSKAAGLWTDRETPKGQLFKPLSLTLLSAVKEQRDHVNQVCHGERMCWILAMPLRQVHVTPCESSDWQGPQKQIGWNCQEWVCR